MQIQTIVAFAALAIRASTAPVQDSQAETTPYDRALLLGRELQAIVPQLAARDLSKRDCFNDCAEGCTGGLIAPCFAPGCDGLYTAGWYVATHSDIPGS